MTDKEKIKQEIKRLYNLYELANDYQRMGACSTILDFIDSIPEEPVSENLEEVATKWDETASFQPFYMQLDCKGNPCEVKQDITTHKESFKAGAEWQKQQMMKNAVETTIVNDWQYGKDPDHAIIPAIHQRIERLDVDDKVKIIIIKEQQ